MDRITGILGRYVGDKDFREILAGTVATAALKVFGLGLSYFFVYIISARYGAKVTGIYSLTITVIMFSAMIGSLGFNSSVLRFSSQYGLQQRWGTLINIYRKMLFSSLAVSLILGAGIILASGRLAALLFKGMDFSWSVIIIGATVPLFTVLSLNTEVIRGLKKISESEFLRTVSINLCNLVLFFTIIHITGYSIHLPAISYSVAILLTCGLSYIFLRRHYRETASEEEKHEVKSLKEIYQVSLPIYITVLLQAIMEYSGTLLLGYYRSAEDVGIYSVASKFALATSLVLAAINSIVAPKFAELYWNGRIDELKKIVVFSSQLIFWFTMPIIIIYLLVPGYLLSIFGPEFSEGSWALRILSIGQCVNALSGSVGYFMIMTGGQRIFRNIIITATVLNMTSNILLIPSLGIVGASIASAISLSFWNIAALLYIKSKYSINTFYFPLFARR
jgi:O-antigen/teichoic acid export membrane protein